MIAAVIQRPYNCHALCQAVATHMPSSGARICSNILFVQDIIGISRLFRLWSDVYFAVPERQGPGTLQSAACADLDCTPPSQVLHVFFEPVRMFQDSDNYFK